MVHDVSFTVYLYILDSVMLMSGHDYILFSFGLTEVCNAEPEGTC